MDSDVRVVRGINIATAVVSSLLVVFSLFLIILLSLSSTMLTDPEFVDDVMSEMQSEGSSAFDGDSYYDDYDYSGLSQEESKAVVTLGITTIIVMGVGYFLCKIVALIASIWALRAVKNPRKVGSAFGFAIAAIVVSVLTGSFISGALFVVSAVYLNRMRKAYKYAAGYGQAPYGYAQPGQPPYGYSGPGQFGQGQPGQQPQGYSQPGQPPYGYGETGQPPYGYGQEPSSQVKNQPGGQASQGQVPCQPAALQQPPQSQVPTSEPAPQTAESQPKQPSPDGAEQSGQASQEARDESNSSQQ